ncbi:MAG: hypothetical protein AABZ84_04950 [Pseudomonadota bacterium]
MIWGLFGLIFTVILLAVLITKKDLRRALPVALVTIVGIIAFFAWYQDHELGQSKQRITPAEIELAEMRLTEAGRGLKDLSGRLRNHSPHYTLMEVVLRISIEDCLGDGHCEVVDQTTVTLKPKIPPGQARDVRERAYFKSTVQLRGEQRQRFEVVSTRSQ